MLVQLQFTIIDCLQTSLGSKLQITQCHHHQAANVPGRPLVLEPRCNCCYLPYNKQSISICFSEQQILYLGIGHALFFRYLIICAVVMFIPVASYCIICLSFNYKQSITLTQNNIFTLIVNLSNYTETNSKSMYRSYIFGTTIIVLTILIPILYKIGSKLTHKYYSSSNQYFYPQALSLLFKCQKMLDSSEQQIAKVFNDWYQVQMKIQNKQVPSDLNIVQKVYFHYNMAVYKQIVQEIAGLQPKKNDNREQENFLNFEYSRDVKGNYSKRSYSSVKSTKQLLGKINRLDSLKQKIRNKELDKTNKFIVIFKNYSYYQTVKLMASKRMCRKQKNKLVFSGQNFTKIYQAPFPHQIDFQIQNCPTREKLTYRALSWFINFVIIGVGTGLEYLILYLYIKFPQISNLTFISVIIALLIYLISQIATYLSLMTIKLQKQPNKSSFSMSQIYHTLITNFFLKCASPILIYQLSGISMLSTGGFIQTITWLMFIWPILLIINRLFNFKLVYYRLSNRSSSKLAKTCKVQKQANKAFQKPQNMTNLRYAELTQLIIISFVFVSFIPLSIIISFICILVSLLTQKIAFVYLYKQPQPSSQSTFLTMSAILWKSTIFLTLGHFYFICECIQIGIVFQSLYKIIFCVILGINVIVLFVPFSIFHTSPSEIISYQQIKDKLINNYSDFNILYQQKYIPQAQPQKSAHRLTSTSVVLAEQLNTMSKSLETTLRQKLFNNKNPALQVMENRGQEDSIHFQYDSKVVMPEVKEKKVKKVIPPIYKQNRADVQFRKRNPKKQDQKNALKQELIKLTSLTKEQQQIEVRKKIKIAIHDSISKIK